jgi:hypothetical protein
MNRFSVWRVVGRSGLVIFIAVTASVGWAAVVTTPEQTLTFDTLTNTDLGTGGSIATGYGSFVSGSVHFSGFDWAAGAAPVGVANSHDDALNGFAIGFANGAVSQPNVAFKRGNAGSSTIEPISGKFVFRGGFFTAAFDPTDIGLPANTVQTLTLQGISHQLSAPDDVVSQTITLSASAPVALSVDWSGSDGKGIDSLMLTINVTDGVTVYSPLQWVMDDFRFAVAVPEPSSALYLFAGVALLCAIGARRRLGS